MSTQKLLESCTSTQLSSVHIRKTTRSVLQYTTQMVHVTAFSMWINRTQSSSTHIQAQRISHDQRAKLHRIVVHWIWTVHWSSITNTFRITHKYTQLKHSFNTHFSRTTFLQCFDTVGWTPGRTYATKTDSWGFGMVICLVWGSDCLHMVRPKQLLSPKPHDLLTR